MMNPQRERHLQTLGAPSPSLSGAPAEAGDGTALSGYAAPELGPFECENCRHFQPENEQFEKNCDQPDVIADPEVTQVEPEGCCNKFQSAHAENQAEEHTEGLEEPEGTPHA